MSFMHFINCICYWKSQAQLLRVEPPAAAGWTPQLDEIIVAGAEVLSLSRVCEQQWFKAEL